jgi:hypothetical protein
MSLDNLVKINQLKPHTTNAEEVQRLLAAARRNLADTAVQAISDENRFDVAYKAIMQCALIGLLANGYRPSTTTPGHHQTMIQALELTLGVPPTIWRVLDALRKKRNLNDYSGDLIEPAAVRQCIAQANALFETTQRWLQVNRSDLFQPPA